MQVLNVLLLIEVHDFKSFVVTTLHSGHILKNPDLIMLFLLLTLLNGFPLSTKSQICDSSYKPWKIDLLFWPPYKPTPFPGRGAVSLPPPSPSKHVFPMGNLHTHGSLYLHEVLGLQYFLMLFSSNTCTPTPSHSGPQGHLVKLSLSALHFFGHGS